VARGFESKDVEFQQAEAERRQTSRRELSPDERTTLAERHALELSLARAKADLAAARAPAHQQMLAAAIAALEEQLAARTP